jgi:hypothetical protein
MAKEPSNISNFINLKFKYGIIMINKRLNKQLFIKIINKTKSLSQEPKKCLIYSLHHTTLYDHINQFMLIPFSYVHF